MTLLENKISPPLVAVLIALGMWRLSTLTLVTLLISTIIIALVIIFIIVGIFLSFQV
tara:strand:+ start:7127 stop:7297 length:171 start_codon:yes stop_codon:yes gene_type:complete